MNRSVLEEKAQRLRELAVELKTYSSLESKLTSKNFRGELRDAFSITPKNKKDILNGILTKLTFAEKKGYRPLSNFKHYVEKYLGETDVVNPLRTSKSSLKRSPSKGGKWSAKYKRSIDCNNPKGFSQKQHCKYGRKTRKHK